MVNGFNSLAVTKLDVLDDVPELKICVAYRLNGEEIDFVPADARQIDRCEPVYETLPGWNCSLSSARDLGDLPPAAIRYLDRLNELLEVEIDVVGVGAARDAVICRRDLYR